MKKKGKINYHLIVNWLGNSSNGTINYGYDNKELSLEDFNQIKDDLKGICPNGGTPVIISYFIFKKNG